MNTGDRTVEARKRTVERPRNFGYIKRSAGFSKRLKEEDDVSEGPRRLVAGNHTNLC